MLAVLEDALPSLHIAAASWAMYVLHSGSHSYPVITLLLVAAKNFQFHPHFVTVSPPPHSNHPCNIFNTPPHTHRPNYSGPGVHVWVPSAVDMEALGHLLLSLCVPGTVVLLNGHLGGGKTAIARGMVRAFCGDPDLFVPSPTFLLNLTYQEDTAHEPSSNGQQQQKQGEQQQKQQQQVKQQQQGQQQGQQQQQQQQEGGVKSRGQCIHHMDPYRLGNAGERRCLPAPPSSVSPLSVAPLWMSPCQCRHHDRPD
jgi:hypothetical protein